MASLIGGCLFVRGKNGKDYKFNPNDPGRCDCTFRKHNAWCPHEAEARTALKDGSLVDLARVPFTEDANRWKRQELRTNIYGRRY